MKRYLAIVLTLCLLVTVLAPGAGAIGIWYNSGRPQRENLLIELLDGNLFDLDLFRNDWDQDLKIEKIEDEQQVRILIVLDSLSVVEMDRKAVYSAETQKTMDALGLEQANVIAAIEKQVLGGEKLEISYQYAWLLNGVAATVPYGMLKQIRAIPGVRQVLLQPQYETCSAQRGTAELMTTNAGSMIGRESVWADGYTGKGIKIAVIDTGLDVDHPNFAALPADKLTEASYDVEDIAAVLDQLHATERYNEQAQINKWDMLTADDLYYNSKVIYGFNYADNNLDVTHDNDTMGDHGTHVSGIAAANKVDGSDVMGVAPDAQLYVLKTYGADHGGYADDILAALEDALLLGADVINMSLGTNAGFSTNTEEVNAIYDRVSETGTVLSVAAGNNYTSGYGNTWGDHKNQTMYPDNAVISQPGVYNNVLSVASVDNTHIWRRYLAAGEEMIGFVETSGSYEVPSIDVLEGASFQIVKVPGNGKASDFEEVDVEGKIALIKRGVETFKVKCENAEAAGAVAVIVYNNETGEFGMDLTGCEVNIPCVSIMQQDGEMLVEMLEENPEMTVFFSDDLTPLPSQYGYQLSEFSSWGVAPDLSLEPDITAPGGNIYSTVMNGEYGLMSGTSMAAPAMSGLVALVMQYIRENNIQTELSTRDLVQHLLVSTSTPLVHEESGLHYSPRQQGSGLGNAYQATHTLAYLSVEGMDTPKAELGDDAEKTGKYAFTYTVHNFGNETLYYRLHTAAQTEGHTTLEDHPGRLFMSGKPKNLGAITQETSDALLYTHDLSGDGLTDAYDAYLLYQQTLQGVPEAETFRYDINQDEAASADDVQEYLNALVGLASKADLDDQVLQVPAGQSVDVDVQINLSTADKAYLSVHYPNGGYVEGFTFLEAVEGVDLSLPYLAFFGDWSAAPVLDDGYYWQLLDAEVVADPEEPEDTEDETRPTDPSNPTVPSEPTDPSDPSDPTDSTEPTDPEEDGDFKDEELEEDSKPDIIVGNQYSHVLWTEFYGMPSTFYPGFNAYVQEEFDQNHISISPNGDGFVDTVDDIYISLLRNARYLTFRYVDADTGEVYYDQTAEFVSKSVYTAAYGQILPAIYSWMYEQVEPFTFTGSDGKTLPNNTRLLLQVEARGDFANAQPDVWEVPVTIDVEGPELLSAVKTTDENGKVWLDLTFRDNLSVAAVALMNSNGEDIYHMDPTVDTEPDENGYRNYTARYDITELSGKLMIVLADYALNESYFGLNVAGEGTPYGELVGYQYNFDRDNTGWVAFNTGVSKNEVQITTDAMEFVAAEYVGGYVFAQTDGGALYGFRYADMLEDRIDVGNTFIAQLERTYHDMAYDYTTGQLYGLMSYEDGSGYPTTEIYTINIRGEYTDETTGETVAPYAETWMQSRGGLYSLCITVDDAGTIYLLGTNERGKTELWESYESSFGVVFRKKMSMNAALDYAQSMAFNHNDKTLYWAQFYPTSIDTFLTELYVIDLAREKYESVGTLSGETCGLFSPLTEQTIASNPIYQNIPQMDPDEVGRPVLRKKVVNMNVGAQETLIFDFDPWYTNHQQVVWSSSDENVVTVDENGTITAVSKGEVTITVAAADDPTRFDTCLVSVTALSLEIEGVISSMESGVGSTGGTRLYKYAMENSEMSMELGNSIYAPVDMNFGLDLATSVFARGYIWACEYGNTGMIYQIDPATGAVVDVLMPTDGDMVFGLTYNEQLDTFTGIMNMYLFVDLKLTHEEQEEMMGSYDPDSASFNYHRINMLEYLLAAEGNFTTGEYGQGASSEIVMCGITTLPDSFHYVDTGLDFLGNEAVDTVRYNSTQTLVVLDNVGRLWYIDEICGLQKSQSGGMVRYTSQSDAFTEISAYTGSQRSGVIELDNGDGTYNVFYIRSIEETPLTDLFRADAMPRITYHFSDIEFGGYTSEGAPIFALSLYDYWNNGTTNELYLYTPTVTRYDEAAGAYVTEGQERFYYLGDTGAYQIIASIHHFRVLGGLED